MKSSDLPVGLDTQWEGGFRAGGFSPLLGNVRLKERLHAFLHGATLPHAYVLEGEPGSGKKTAGRLFAAALFCLHEDQKPCGQCLPCKKVLEGIHPDFQLITPEAEKKEIGVDQVRALKLSAYIRPNEAERRFYLVDSGGGITTAAQNAFLKLLEEPPSYAVFFLLCKSRSDLLDTVLSRCVQLRTEPLSPDEVLAALRIRCPEEDPGALQRVSSACGGNLGKALVLLGQEQLHPLALPFLRELTAGTKLTVFEVSQKLEGAKRQEISAFLDAILGLTHSALLGKLENRPPAHAEPGFISYAPERLAALEETIKRHHSMLSYNASLSVLTASLAANSWRNLHDKYYRRPV